MPWLASWGVATGKSRRWERRKGLIDMPCRISFGAIEPEFFLVGQSLDQGGTEDFAEGGG